MHLPILAASMTNLPFIVALVAAVAAPLGVYLLGVRRLSGTVSHSAASELWTESANLRADYQKRIAELNTVVRSLEKDVSELRGNLLATTQENYRLRRVLIEHGLLELTNGGEK